MSVAAFDKLCSLLKKDITPPQNSRMARNALPPRLVVATALRYFAGASYIDLMRRTGISKPAVYKCIRRVVTAVVTSTTVGVTSFPQILTDCQSAANGWAAISGPTGDRGLFKTAIAMIDGILVRMQAPSSSDTNKAEDYRSGHKKAYGVNVQAACDSSLRFVFVSCKTPGKTNDLKAYMKSALSALVESLPIGYWCGGDNAYVNTEHMIVPIPGSNLDPYQDAFNFYLSQLRIRIEMTFGIWVARWGVLWRPLRVKLRHVPSLILCLCRLHNYCIDESERNPPLDAPAKIDRPASASLVLDNQQDQFVLAGRQNDFRTLYTFQRQILGSSLRNMLVADIKECNFERPLSNRVRNST